MRDLSRMDSSSVLPSVPQSVTPADHASANLNLSTSPTTNPTSVTASQSGTPYSSPRRTGNGSDTPSPSSAPSFRQNGHKSCDACKTRKVKCPNVKYPNPCANCVRRKEACHFGTKKVPRRNVTKHLRYTQPSTEPAPGTMLCYVDAPDSDGNSWNGGSTADNTDPIPSLYVDHMLAQAQAQAKPHGKEESFVKGNGIFGGSYSLTFFSESRLVSLSKRLHNNKVGELVRRMNGIISGRLRRNNETPTGETNTTSGSGQRSSSSTASGGPSLYIASVTDDTPPMPVDPEFAASCIRYYFNHVHKLYPFLDRAAFEARALPAPGSGEEGEKALAKSLQRSKAWSSLYYTVMAIGCVYSEGSGSGSANSTPAAGASFLGHLANITSKQSSTPGSFEPGKGTAWRLFSMALANLSDLFILPDSLLTLQALTAMAIYGLGVSCLSIERVILAEASRRAQSLASNFGTSTSGSTTSSVTFQRTFWTLYTIEKIMSFHFGRSSTFVDSDIACPISAIIDDDGDDDGDDSASSAASTATNCWFILGIRHARLLSRTYSSLFSIGKARVSAASNLATIDRLCDEAEEWRQSIPSTRGLRPECSSWRGNNRGGASSFTTHGNSSSKISMALRSTVLEERNIALGLHFLYHSLVVILARARLHHLSLHQADVETQKKEYTDPKTSTERKEQALLNVQSLETDARRALMTSARSILELTPIIDVEPYMPLWTLAVIPLTALFVLFDLVVDQPNDASRGPPPTSGPRTISSDTALNLALLDMGAGYFSRIEYASNSSLPGSLISEFAHIARDYINDYRRGAHSVHAPLPLPPPPPPPEHEHEHERRDSQDEDSSGAVHPIPLLQPTTRILSQHSEQPTQSNQRPLPVLPPVMAQQEQPAPPIQSQINLIDASGLAGWPTPSVSEVTTVPSTSDGSIPLVGGPNVTNFTDSLGYGFVTDSYQPGSADFSGTDVMGLFTSNHYFLSEMDGILYNGL